MIWLRTAPVNGQALWELKIPLTIVIADEHLRRIPLDPQQFEDTLDESLGMVREQALHAIELAIEHADDAFESETEIELEGLSNPKEVD